MQNTGVSFTLTGSGQDQTKASAFCLWFDKHVVIEFSKKGNATYVYTLAAFERHVRPELNGAWTVKDLKEPSAAETWTHGDKWESRFRMKLGALGIWAR
jgi:hypothetical protein